MVSHLRGIRQPLIVVTGLPRSGTSMVMQMLAAGGVELLTDGARQADENNPRGYFESERVKSLPNDTDWLQGARGKAVKIIVPLVAAIPPGLPCRAILIERDLDEVLDSQEQMLARLHADTPMTPALRRKLKDESALAVSRAKRVLARRPETVLLVLEYARAIADPMAAARAVSEFLGGGMDPAALAAAIDPALYRNRAG